MIGREVGMSVDENGKASPIYEPVSMVTARFLVPLCVVGMLGLLSLGILAAVAAAV
jgi:hypothetical protein